MFEKFGYDGTRHALQHAVLALLHNSPLVLVITPPPTIVTRRRRTCAYACTPAIMAAVACWTCARPHVPPRRRRRRRPQKAGPRRSQASGVKHYSDKGPRDETSGCVRVDLPNDIRRKVVDLLPRDSTSCTASGGRRGAGGARGHVVGPGADATSDLWQPQFFEGLYHFNPVGSAMIACLVHKKLLTLCGAAGAARGGRVAPAQRVCGELEELACRAARRARARGGRATSGRRRRAGFGARGEAVRGVQRVGGERVRGGLLSGVGTTIERHGRWRYVVITPRLPAAARARGIRCRRLSGRAADEAAAVGAAPGSTPHSWCVKVRRTAPSLTLKSRSRRSRARRAGIDRARADSVLVVGHRDESPHRRCAA